MRSYEGQIVRGGRRISLENPKIEGEFFATYIKAPFRNSFARTRCLSQALMWNKRETPSDPREEAEHRVYLSSGDDATNFFETSTCVSTQLGSFLATPAPTGAGALIFDDDAALSPLPSRVRAWLSSRKSVSGGLTISTWWSTS